MITRVTIGSQKGVALVVILTFLLILSLLVVSGIESGMLETGMVANAGRIEEALANAEYGLRLGEAEVQSLVADGSPLDIDAPDPVYPLEGAGAIDPTVRDWTSIPIKGVSQEPDVEYVIQYAGTVSVEADSSSVVMPLARAETAPAHLFIVTARAEITGTVRIVQSVYLTAGSP